MVEATAIVHLTGGVWDSRLRPQWCCPPPSMRFCMLLHCLGAHLLSGFREVACRVRNLAGLLVAGSFAPLLLDLEYVMNEAQPCSKRLFPDFD